MMNRLLVTALLVCGACASGPGAKKDPAAPSVTPKERARNEARVAELLAHIPAHAIGAVAIPPHATELVGTWLKDNPALHAELSDFLERRVGVDFTAVTGIVVYATKVDGSIPEIAALFTMPTKPGAKLLGKAVEPVDGVSIVEIDIEKVQLQAAVLPAGVLVGTPSGIRVAISRERGQTPALTPQSGLGAMLTRAVPNPGLIVGVNLTTVPMVGAMIEQYGAKDVVLSGSLDAAEISAGGDRDKLEGARSILKGFLDEAIKKADEAHAKAIAGDSIFEGVAGILAYHQAHRWISEGEPRFSDGRLVSHLTFDFGKRGSGMMIAPAVIGILAAVAIPSFMKFTQRSKASEAKANLRAMRTAFLAWQAQDAKAKLPPSTGWTPPTLTCNQPATDPFNAPAWKTLQFQPTGPLRYQYRFSAIGSGKTARVRLEAQGDLDCDGTLARFWYEGGRGVGGEIELGDINIENETE